MMDNELMGGQEEERSGEGDGGKGRKTLTVVVPPSKQTTFFWQVSNTRAFV
jgi:hypothetical protein